MKPLSEQGTNLGTYPAQIDAGKATVVRLYNSGSSDETVDFYEYDPMLCGHQIGSLTIPAGEVIYAQKKAEDFMSSTSNSVYYTKVAYSHMMSYESYTSSGGGGSSIVTQNLVLNLDAGDNSSYGGSGTTWTDLSGEGNNATLVNGVTYNSGDGGYFIFDGTNDAATISAGSDFAYGTGDFTVETWFNVTGTSPAAWGEILYAQQGPSHNYFLVVSSEFSPVQKKPGFIFGTGGGGTKTLSSTTYTEGTWHHLVVTRNGTTVTIYLDNSSVGTVTCSQDFDNTTYVPTIGSNSQQGFGHFDGKIAQLRIYKGKGFLAADVSQNYNATKSRYGY